MRTSDHPAAKPRQYREPVYRADDEPETDQSGLPTNPAEREALRQRLIEQGALAPVSPDIPEVTADELETAHAAALTREPIASAPQDGGYIRAFWGEDDLTGRLVRWRQGRHFNNRRWVTGGTWAPADGMMPLPVQPPTEWLKPVMPPEPEVVSAEVKEEAA